MLSSRPESFVHILRDHAEQRPDQPVYHALAPGADAPVDVLTFGGLDRNARAIAVAVRQRCRPGDRALLLYPPGLDFVAGFFGCLYAGVVPVPVYPPNPARLARTLPRLAAVAVDADAAVLLGSAPLLSVAEPLLGDVAGLAELGRVPTDEVDGSLAGSWRRPDVDPDAPALIQYTSGSTATPKGVVLSHANVLANCRQMRAKIEADPEAGARFVSWLPLYHDFGLITSVLHTAWSAGQSWLMSPLDFLADPLSWLIAIGRYRGTVTAAPNFAYDLCVRRADPDRLRDLDLSSWRLSLCGGEPVSQRTLERFTATFAPYGLRPECLYPAYGMAECTVVATGGHYDRPWRHRTVAADALAGGEWRPAERDATRIRELVGCGEAMAGSRVRIVDPDTLRPCPPGRIGEIWISGPHVGLGYWNRPDESERVFRARVAGEDETTYLRSGDLGVVDDGELYVTGRRKDVIFVAGRNIYPQDIERTVADVDPALRPGATAAYGVAVDGTGNGTEDIVVVQEIARGATGDHGELCEAIRRAVHAEHALPVSRVVLIAPGSIPKTSSGKIQRGATRAAIDAGELPVVHDWRPPASPARVTAVNPAAPPRQPHICVIGAGPAGLVAAHALRRRGYERITVLERGDRVGGRTTDYHDGTGGYHGDVFVATDRYTTVRALADEVGAVPVFDDRTSTRRASLQDLRLSRRLLGEPDSTSSVAEHLRHVTAHLDPGHHDAALASLLTMSGYGFPADVPLPYFRMLGSILPPTRRAVPCPPRVYPDLWQRLAKRLTDQPGTQLLLRTEVTGVEVEPGSPQDAPLLRVRTTTSPDGNLFDRVLVAVLPHDALRFLDAEDFAAAHELLRQVRRVDYAVTAFTATGLTEPEYVLEENFRPARRGHVMGLHRAGEVYYALQYADGPVDPGSCLEADVATVGGAVRQVCLRRRLPFFPHVSADALASGFYRELDELQGRSNTFFLGALPGFDLTETVARHATALVEDRFDRYAALTDAEDENEGQVPRWFELMSRFPVTPPHLQGFLPRYYRLPGSDQLFLDQRDEVVAQGVLDVAVDPLVDDALRRGPWALRGKVPAPVSLIALPNPVDNGEHLFVMVVKVPVPPGGAIGAGQEKAAWMVFGTLPCAAVLDVRTSCDLMDGLLSGDAFSLVDAAGPDLFFHRARRGIANPLLTSYDTYGAMIYETPDLVAVLHLAPRETGGAATGTSARPLDAVRAHLLRREVTFDVMVQSRPKASLPFVGSGMLRDDWAEWNENTPWSGDRYPLRGLGTLTLPVQDVDAWNADDIGMTAAHGAIHFDDRSPEPPLLSAGLFRAFQRIIPEVRAVTEAEFRRTSRTAGIEEMLVDRIREMCGMTVDRTSNLVDLGMSSVELVQLAQYVRTALRVDVPATVLFDLPDLGEVVAYLEATVEGRPYTAERRVRTVELRAGRRAAEAADAAPAGTTVCCFPPIVGSGDVYRALSAGLGGDVLLRTMNDLNLYQDVPRDVMVPELGLAYADEIQRDQPAGPYHLLGYSFGGLLAYEAAHILTGRGARVASLVCLDGPAPHALATLARLNAGVDPDTVTGRMIGALLAGGSRYTPPPLDQVVHLVRARDDKVFGLEDDTLGWSAAGVRTVVHWVAGDHLSMMKRPCVTEVTDIVRKLLETPASPSGERDSSSVFPVNSRDGNSGPAPCEKHSQPAGRDNCT